MFRTSIRTKLIAFLVAAAIVPLTTSIVITHLYTKRTVTQEQIEATSALLQQGKENIRHYMDTIHQTSLTVYNDEKLYANIETGATDYLSEKETFRALLHMSYALRDIYQVYLHMEKANQPYLVINSFTRRSPAAGKPYRHPFGAEETTVEPPHVNRDYGFSRISYIEQAVVMTMHRSIRRMPVKEQIGTLAIDVKMDGLAAMCESMYDKTVEELYILDRSGAIVYGPDPGQWGSTPGGGWVPHLMALPEPAGSFFWNGDGFHGIQVYDRLETPYLSWTIVKRIPNEALYKQARQLTQINTFVLAAFLLVSITVTVGVTFLFTAPIKRLLGYMSEIQKGNLNVPIDMNRKDEFGILAARFRAMMQHINNLIMKEYRLELANRTHQLKALQAQINPHFLYNALQSIGTLALQMNAPNIYRLVSALGKMMRYSMNTAETAVPLAKELDHIRSYVELQKQRFDDKLELHLHVDKETESLEVPKMILQPVVENYFKHGFDPSSGQKGRLTIASAFDADGRLVVTVEDNGKGIDPERLEQIRRKLRRAAHAADAETEQDGGIGLINVLSRLKLFYGETASMDIEQGDPQGLKVTLIIPRKERNEDDENVDRR